MLDSETQGLYENGFAFGRYLQVLKDLLKRNNQDIQVDLAKMNSLKNQITPAARLYNWNIICNELDNVGIVIDADQKSLAVAGDQEQIHMIFQRLERFLVKIAGKQILNFDNLNSLNTQPSLSHLDTQVDKSSNARRGNKATQKKSNYKFYIYGCLEVIKDGVDILTMNQEREPVDTESTLELILNTLCRAFNMKPKQSAALLTNNNQFLIHSIVKGVKGRYEPLISWYQDVYANSKHLTVMLELENEQFPSSTNFKKVLQTLSCGLYSHSIDICKWCSKLLTKIGYDFGQNSILFEQAMQWFLEKEGGLELTLHALKKHPDLAEEFVLFVSQFSTVNDQVEQVYKIELKKYFSSPLEYVNAINDLFPYLTSSCSKEIQGSGILEFWIESCIRQSDNDGKHSFDERISAITLLSEIWMAYADYIDSKEEMANSILQMLKRGARDRYKPIRTVAICELFRLLDKFSEEKNASAPAIYKTLIFSLVENPQDSMLRDIYFSNFTQLFEANPSIPIGLVIEPLIKQIQVSEGVAYFYKIFDFDFFSYLGKHPKLKLENAIPLIDLLAKVYLNDVSYASAACVPFMLVCSKFINEEQMQEFIIKFLTIGLSMLMGLEKNAEEIQRQHQQLQLAKEGVGRGSRKMLALPPPPMPQPKKLISKKLTKEEKLKSLKEQEEDVSRRLKKTHIIEVAMKILNLRNEDINDQLRDMLLSTNKRFNEIYGYFNKGIMALLKWWGDPDSVMGSYIRAIEEREQREREDQERREQIEKEKKRRDQEEKERIEREERDKRQSEVQERLKLMAAEGVGNEDLEEEERRLLQGYDSADLGRNNKNGSMINSKSQSVRNSMAVLPYTGTRSSNQVKNVRALQQIEKIKKGKLEMEEQKRLEEERKRLNSARKKKKLREQLEKRKIELGVGQKSQNDDIKALIFKEGTNDKEKLLMKNIMHPQIRLIDLDEEEERDKEAVTLFMKKYAKLWRNLFHKYANSGYNSKQVNNFDQLNEKLQTMSIAEMTKLLKDHATYPTLLNKEELQQLFRLINTKVVNRNDLQALDYNGYLQFMTQLAFFCFARPPKDLSHLPPVEQIRCLVSHFEQATRQRGQSLVLYEDPDATDLATRDLIKALNEKINQDPSYPIPEGYFKQVEKTPQYQYRVPSQIVELVDESQVIAIEILDELLNGLFEIHILEPLVTFEERIKVKPMIRNQYKPQAEALNYMRKVEKKIKPIDDARSNLMSAQEKRQQAMEIKPSVNITLKLEVAQYPIKERPFIQEVAEVLEEMLQATEKGQDKLQSRPNRAPGQIQNEVKKKKNDDLVKEQEMKHQKEEKRVKRHNELQSEMKKNKEESSKNLEEQKKLREDQQRKEKDVIKKKQVDTRKIIEDRKKVIEDQKQNNLEDMMKKRQEEEVKVKQVNDKKKRERSEFMRGQKQKMIGEFDKITKDRQELVNQQEELQKMKKEKESKIRSEMEGFIKEHQQDKEKEKLERKSIDEFLVQHDVESVFGLYDKSLHHMYKFYASQDKKDLSFTLDKTMNTINFREFIRFGFQQNIVPVLLPPDDMVQIYRQLIRERIEQVSGGLDENYIGDNNFQQVLDYEFFKKAIVRIAIMAQDSLGGQREDLLFGKLDFERQKQDQERSKREKIKQKEQYKQKAEKEVLAEMKQEFLAQTSKSPNSKQGKRGKTSTVDETYEINSLKKQNEEAFFDKWIKQREAQGVSLKKRIIGREKEGSKKIITKKRVKIEGQNDEEGEGSKRSKDGLEGVREGEDIQRQNSTQGASNLKYTSPAQHKTTKTLKELQALQEQTRIAEKDLKGIKIEERQVKASLDVKIITAKTIEALLLFLGIQSDDSKQGLDNKLNQARIEIQGQKPTKFKKQLKANKFEAIKENHEEGEALENVAESMQKEEIEQEKQEQEALEEDAQEDEQIIQNE